MKIAAQLFSVRGYVAENGYGAALKALAEIGFTSVEHACGFGEFEGKPEELKKFMDDLGLSMIGTHLGTDNLFEKDKLDATIELYSKLGAKYLISPWDSRFWNAETQPEFIEKINEAAEYLKKYGMFCGFHNHKEEFDINPKSGKTYWETFADKTIPEVVLEQDCGWTTLASRDAAELIRKYPGRSQILHFKPDACEGDVGKKPVIGRDSVPWADIIKAANEVGGTECFIIEQEWYIPGRSDTESIAESYNGLRAIMG